MAYNSDNKQQNKLGLKKTGFPHFFPNSPPFPPFFCTIQVRDSMEKPCRNRVKKKIIRDHIKQQNSCTKYLFGPHQTNLFFSQHFSTSLSPVFVKAKNCHHIFFFCVSLRLLSVFLVFTPFPFFFFSLFLFPPFPPFFSPNPKCAFFKMTKLR